MFRCKDCHSEFRKKEFLDVHVNFKRKYCLEYKDILFVCLKCNLKFKGIRNLNIHKEHCISSDNFESLYLEDEKEKNMYLEKISYLDNEYKKLELQFNIEILKNKIYSQIIIQKLGIKLDDIFENKEDGIHIYDTDKTGNISLYVHEYVRKENLSEMFNCKKEEIIYTEEEIKPKKQQYRTIKITGEEHKQSPFIMNDDNNMIDKSPYIIYNDTDEIDIDKNKAKIQDCFESLKTTKTYNKILKEINMLRNAIMPTIKINEYIDMIKSHVDIITEILKSKECKKITSMISKSLSYIDMRLIFFNDFDKHQINTDDIQKLKKSLNLSVISFNNNNNNDVFNISKFCDNFYNYSVVLFSIKENITRFFINNNGFFNVIYVPLPLNHENYPYSFYMLEKVTKKHREWNMDCRLETFSNNFIRNVRQYMIDIYKKICYEVFHDNIYRIEHENKSQVLECDCEQLISNILTLADPVLFSKLLINIVKEHSVYIPTENDKFNLRNDDKIQKKKYENYKPYKDDILDVIKSMFDSMKTEDALDFYRKKYLMS